MEFVAARASVNKYGGQLRASLPLAQRVSWPEGIELDNTLTTV
jgi:hypothetical protein